MAGSCPARSGGSPRDVSPMAPAPTLHEPRRAPFAAQRRHAVGAVAARPPRLMVDTATGAVAQRMDFDEFGRVLLGLRHPLI